MGELCSHLGSIWSVSTVRHVFELETRGVQGGGLTSRQVSTECKCLWNMLPGWCFVGRYRAYAFKKTVFSHVLQIGSPLSRYAEQIRKISKQYHCVFRPCLHLPFLENLKCEFNLIYVVVCILPLLYTCWS